MSSAAKPKPATGLMQLPSLAVSADIGWRYPFTAAQWRELEHQALIFKYLIAGVPVPPDLLLPIQLSLEASASHLYHQYPPLRSVGYFSFYGKKLDPEPGRCRRTDGKKWRCSKDAHPDSKYCERHMHRGRNRSRKHVESKTNLSHLQSQSHSSSSTMTSLVASGSNGSFKNVTLQSDMAGVSKAQSLSSAISGSSQLQSGCQTSKINNKGYLDRAKITIDEHNFFSDYPCSLLDSSWGLMPSQVPSFPITMQDLNEVTTSPLPKKLDQQNSYFRNEFGLPGHGKQECQSFRPFYYEWPEAKETWLDLEDEQSEQNSSATQLSISIPMAASDFSPYDD